jgi:serpin B
MQNLKDSTLAPALDRFSFNLFLEIIRQKPHRNTFISPYGIAMGLSLLANGASGNTRKAIADVLGVGVESLGLLNNHHAAMLKHLKSHGRHMDFRLVNAVWTKQGYEFNADFLAIAKDIYQSEISALDFAAPDVLSTLNNWGKQATQGKISQFMGNVDPNTAMILANALYFRALWLDPFEKIYTKPMPFKRADGSQTEISMMRRKSTYVYLRTETFKAVELLYLPYHVYQDVPAAESPSMLVFLPDEESSLDEFLQNLTYTNWLEWMSSFNRVRGTVGLPRFTCQYETNLNTTLSAMGMGVAFDREQANYSELLVSPTPIYLSNTHHKTYLKVDENGTVAASLFDAAARLAGMTRRRYVKEFEMICDRPFFFVIGDNITGTVLFMGAVYAPEAASKQSTGESL